MNKKESTFSTTGSCSEVREDMKISEDKTLALLKLVYYERKSIKQSAKYLKINYNSGKRIVKNFRRGRLPIAEKSESSYEPLIKGLKEKPVQREVSPDSVCQKLQFQIRNYSTHLMSLNSEIQQNQMAMMFLTNYAFKMYQTVRSLGI